MVVNGLGTRCLYAAGVRASPETGQRGSTWSSVRQRALTRQLGFGLAVHQSVSVLAVVGSLVATQQSWILAAQWEILAPGKVCFDAGFRLEQ